MSSIHQLRHWIRPHSIPSHIEPRHGLFKGSYLGMMTESTAIELERREAGLESNASLVSMLGLTDETVTEKRHVIFNCTDGDLDSSPLDSFILARYFHLLQDWLEVSDGVGMSLPFTREEVGGALSGISGLSYSTSIATCVSCIDFLQPIDSTYYLRYDMGELRDVELLKRIARDMDDDLKMNWSLISLSHIVSPIPEISAVYNILAKQRQDEQIRYLCRDHPSLLCLYYMRTNNVRQAVDMMTTADLSCTLHVNSRRVMARVLGPLMVNMMLKALTTRVEWHDFISLLYALGYSSLQYISQATRLQLPFKIDSIELIVTMESISKIRMVAQSIYGKTL